MPRSAFERWADQSLSVAHLEAGGALWLPYGWQAASLNEVSEALGSAWGEVLAVPYLSGAIARVCPELPSVCRMLTSYVVMKQGQQHRGWLKQGADLIAWLEGVCHGSAVADVARAPPPPVERAADRSLKRKASRQQSDEGLPKLPKKEEETLLESLPSEVSVGSASTGTAVERGTDTATTVAAEVPMSQFDPEVAAAEEAEEAAAALESAAEFEEMTAEGKKEEVGSVPQELD